MEHVISKGKFTLPKRKDDRIILHFDYDSFYASVHEHAHPALKSLPLAIQQKQIIVTCNYEARRRGLYKLQLITEAKRICPDVIIILGEDISLFRDASRELYAYLLKFMWVDGVRKGERRAERLGFDEVWMDMTEMIDYNTTLISHHDLQNSFFQLSREDPTQGFTFDASVYSGHTYPPDQIDDLQDDFILSNRLKLASHLASHIRNRMAEEKGYTATVGISTNKLLSKLVGNLHKPNSQTTLIPPYYSPTLDNDSDGESNVIKFLDGYDIGSIPSIGFVTAQKLRAFILSRPANFSTALVYGGTKENVSVRDIRLHSELIDSPAKLEEILSAPGMQKGIGRRVYELIRGFDDEEVKGARRVPGQVGVEDSYIKLDHLEQVMRELKDLSGSLLKRMRIDLMDYDDEDELDEKKDLEDVVVQKEQEKGMKWIAYPKTIRLTTRPRMPLNSDGTRTRSFKRTSHSASLPSWIFNVKEDIHVLADRLVKEVLIGMFRKLHPERQGWNLSLVNITVTNMIEVVGAGYDGETKSEMGRDISGMFKRQEDVLKDFRVIDDYNAPNHVEEEEVKVDYEVDTMPENEKGVYEDESDDEDELEDAIDQARDGQKCNICGATIPVFALSAHLRYHELDD